MKEAHGELKIHKDIRTRNFIDERDTWWVKDSQVHMDGERFAHLHKSKSINLEDNTL